MKISGFTFIRNAVRYDYPIVEAICSILPIVDEMVVALGQSDDETLALILSIGSPKIKIIPTIWDESLREGGKVLAVETDKALAAVASDSDWAFYLQGDEVIHERYLPVIKEAMEKYKDRRDVEGFLFRYLHFYGSYNYVGTAREWYRNEIRIVRPNIGVKSYRDAQGFRIDNRKLNVVPIEACVYHYGWVKPPSVQEQKISSSHRWWHSDEWIKKNVEKADEYNYSCIDMLKGFEGTHPQVMQDRIARVNWTFEYDPRKSHPSGWKNRILFAIEKICGYRFFEYKNYHRVK